MGRYYQGDIEGKFWFGVQSSDDADFFGVVSAEPSELEYYYSKEDLPKVKAGIERCLTELGEYKAKLDRFFDNTNGYNDEMLVKDLEISKRKVRKLLGWYSRLELGQKIETCLEKYGVCSFTAEL